MGAQCMPGSGSAIPGVPAPQAPRSCGSRPLRPLLSASLLPSQARLRAGWEEISPEFPFHTSRLNFLSVSRPLAVCSFSCHRKCQAKVRGRGPAGPWGGGGLGTRRAWGRGIGVCVGARRRGGGSARVVPSSSLCLCKASAVDRPQVKVKARAGGQGEGATGDGLGSTARSLDVFWGWLAGTISERGAFEGISPSFQGGGGKEGEGDAVQLSCGPHRALVGPICAV